MKTITKTCYCGTEYTFEPHEYVRQCADCQADKDKRIAEDKANEEAKKAERRRQDALATVDRLTPARMKKTEVDHADFNKTLWRKVEAWKPTDDRPWLGLIGETGSCKTRIAYLMARKLADEGLLLKTITGPDFGSFVLAQFRDQGPVQTTIIGSSTPSVRDHLDEFFNADLVIFDELGKVRGTPAIVSEIFALIDHRHRENKPTIWTSNRLPEDFCGAWGDEYAGPAAGRIIESSTIFKA